MDRQSSRRFESIDILRGLIMIIMALDHSRVFFNWNGYFSDTTNIETTTPLLFFTRWISHLCAPGFVFLAGTGIFLFSAKRGSKKETAVFLITRGLWLILVEITIVNFVWGLDPTFSIIELQVIWAIGISMIALAGFIYLPKFLSVFIGAALIVTHNMFDSVLMTELKLTDFIWYLLHQPSFFPVSENVSLHTGYPLIPWIGVIVLGYHFGEFYKKDFPAEKRKQLLYFIGGVSILLFLILRYFNLFGYKEPWMTRHSFIYSVMDFFNTNKYPPSFLFLLMTLGPSMIFLAWIEDKKNKVTDILNVFGSVPFFYYIAHLYLLQLLSILSGGFINRILVGGGILNLPLSVEINLFVVYLMWVIAVILLYPMCFKYRKYKFNNKHKWWLSYL